MSLPRIAPKVTDGANPDSAASPTSPSSLKSFVCFNCATRKTRCDKDTAAAGSRKRKATEDANGRLERFERILSQHGLTTKEKGQSEARPVSTTRSDVVDGSYASPAEAAAPTGKLIVDQRNSRYINSTLWREVESHGLGEIVEEDIFGAAADFSDSTAAFPPASLSRGLLGATESLLEYHPSATHATRLWKIYAKNVEPLYKFLHTPSAQNLVATSCQDLSHATPADQCLLFAIYLLAVYSMNEEDCSAEFNQSRALLLAKYDFCIRQALFNASWLSVSHMSTLLAFVMYLSIVRRQADPRSLWIWTGMATRIMQRMGIHRDGEGMGLRQFDVELRRRLYWHLVSLDTYAGRISGTSDAGPPKTWDTKLPLNINDNQIHPDGTEALCVRAGATDMMFSLVRIKLGTLFKVESPNFQSCGSVNPVWDATEKMIDSVENEIESEFLRYCDPVEPVHALTLMTARAAIASARLRQRMPLVAHQSAGRESERREFYGLARRVMDAENHSFTNPILKGFVWYIRASFRWDALICLLVALARPTFFDPEECEGGWERISEFFTHHAEVLEARDSLQRTVGRMTLMAWLANPPPYGGLEPEYITTLRTQHADSLPIPPSRHAEGDASNAELDLYPSPEGDNSYDLSMFLYSSVFGADSGWDGLIDGVFQQ
ncbi:hypothetical protein MBLNU459_g3509t1 [Dothideomycetes sp. NU459]